MALYTSPAMPSLFDGKESIYTRADMAAKNDSKKDRLRITNDTPLDLPTTVRTTLMSTTKLSHYFNEILKPIAKDYYGCEVYPDAAGNMLVKLTFKVINDTDYESRVFMPIAGTAKQSENIVLSKIMTVNAINTGSNRMMMTAYGAELMYDLMNANVRRNVNPDKPETMSKHFGEIKENTGYGITTQNIYNVVTGIDIYKLLSLTFGNTDEKGNRVLRKVNPIRPVIAGAMPTEGSNYIIEIQTMAFKDYEEVMTEIGMTPMPGRITAITGTIHGTIK